MYLSPLAELITRFLYFSLKFEKLLNSLNRNKKSQIRKVSIEEIKQKLIENGIKKGDTVMIHSSFKHIDAKAEDFINFIKEYITEEGNILMPTHPKLAIENGIQVYDIDKSPSTTGYLTEVFRKSKGVLRSHHPFSSVAAWGKDRDYFLANNLNDKNPLPHGIYSPYYKMTEKNSKSFCIGAIRKVNATVFHVAEEVLDEEYPVANLFLDKKVIIKKNGEQIALANVRLQDLEKSKLFVAKSKTEREWILNNILKLDIIRDTRFEIVDNKKCVDYMISEAKKGNTSYPFAKKKRTAK